MACSKPCTITKYEIIREYTAKPVAAGRDCRDIDVEFEAEFYIDGYLANKYPDTQSNCGKGCECLELEDQDPTPTIWSGWYKYSTSFTVKGNCRIGFSIKYKYRSRLYKGNCQIKTKQVSFGDPSKSKPSSNDVPA